MLKKLSFILFSFAITVPIFSMEQMEDEAGDKKQLTLYKQALGIIKKNDILGLHLLLSQNTIDLKFKETPFVATSGFYLLEAAIEASNYNACQDLLNYGADANEKASYWHRITPLWIAIAACDDKQNDPALKICQTLLDNKAEVTDACFLRANKPNQYPVAQLIAIHLLKQPSKYLDEIPLCYFKTGNTKIALFQSNIMQFRERLIESSKSERNRTKPYDGAQIAFASNFTYAANAIVELFTAQGKFDIQIPSEINYGLKTKKLQAKIKPYIEKVEWKDHAFDTE